MINNYIQITFRHIKRNKLFTFINVFGLSLSMACGLMLFLYTYDELSYEKHQDENVYRVIAKMTQGSEMNMKIGTNSLPIGPSINAEIPEILEQSRMITTVFFGANQTILFEDEKFDISGGFGADSTLFNLLNFRFIYGSPDQSLNKPNQIVLDEDIAVKVFGFEDPVGKTVSIEFTFGKFDYEVSGVFDNNFYKTDFKPSYLISSSSQPFVDLIKNSSSWVGNNMAVTLVKLLPGSDIEAVNTKINEVFEKNGKEEIEALGIVKDNILQPLTDVHYDNSTEIDVASKTTYTYIRVMIAIGVLILLLACVNYINLSTAQSGRRALEVGIRKVMGVTPTALRVQFIAESFFIVIIALFLSFLIVELTLPLFNQLAGAELVISTDRWVEIVGFMFLFLVVCVLLAGVYPAFYLSRFNPVEVLKSKSNTPTSVGIFRKVLVVFQFIISISLISAIIIISRQFDYIMKYDSNNSSNVKMILDLSTEEEYKFYHTLKSEVQKVSTVKDVSGINQLPGEVTGDILLYPEGKTMDEAVYTITLNVDYDYMDLMDRKLVSGRTFSENWKADKEANRIVINKTLCEALGFDEQTILGEKLFFSWQGELRVTFEVIGVMEDFNQASLHEPISGMVYMLTDGEFYNHLVVEIEKSDVESAKLELEKVWNDQIKTAAFEPRYMNDLVEQQYKKDRNTYQIIITFSVLSIIISSMGLYALSVFVAERRFKEIGVRKAMGASLKDIILMITSGISTMILIAFLLSIPLVYFAANTWLETFAYHDEIRWWYFLIAGGVSMLIAWLTISYQSLRAAQTNPASVLSEQ